MNTIMPYTLPFLSKLLRIVFLLCLISGLSQQRVEATVTTETVRSHEPLKSKSDTVIQEQIAGLYQQASRSQPTESAAPGGEHNVAVSFKQKFHILCIGGLFFIIGTFFIPHILPQFSGYHEKFTHFLENTVKTYKTVFQFPQYRLVAHSTGTSERARTDVRQSRQLAMSKAKRVPYHTVRCENIVSTVQQPSRRAVTPSGGMIGKFFQQSGFAFTEVSASELRVNSQLSRYKCYGEIPVYVMNNRVVNKTHIQNIYTRMTAQRRQHTDQNGYGKMAFVVVTSSLEESAYHQIYRYRVNQNCTIIPLSHLLVTKSVRHASCAQQLEEKISASTGQCNLYAMNTPVADSLSFFGRTNVLRQLLKAVDQHDSVGILGLPKIGKTWLLWQLKEQLASCITVYVDLQQLPRSGSYLYRKILDECVRDWSFKYPELQLPQLHLSWTGSGEGDAQKFSHDLVTLWKRANAKHPGTKIILLLDGAEQLLPGDPEEGADFQGGQEFIDTLHKISRQHGCLTPMMAFSSLQAARGNRMQSFWVDRKICLTSLTENGCNDMITALGSQMGLLYSEETLSRLYYETGGHPYVTRQVCSLIAKNLKRSKAIGWTEGTTEPTQVQVRDVEQAVSEHLDYKSEYLESLWDELSPAAQEILRMIALNDSCTLDELISPKYPPRQQEERRKTITVLVENDLIEKCENKYSIKMGLFERLILTSN